MHAANSINETTRRDIIVIGGSAGGPEAVMTLLRGLPPDFEAAIFVVCHMLPNSKGHLVDSLNTAGPLVAKIPEDGEEIQHGVVYVAPADRHLLVKRGYVRVTRGPRENRWRPAIDPLFRSAAVAYSNRVIGIVLTGMLDDGTAGVTAIKRCGGLAVVQDPDEAAYPDMPRSAITNGVVDYKLQLSEMSGYLQRLIAEPLSAAAPAPRDLEIEARIAEGYTDEKQNEQLGNLSPLSCPECGGPLWERSEDPVLRFRCRVGHAYAAESLLSAGDETVEATIWAAVRLFDQRANLLGSMAAKDRDHERGRMAQHHEELACEAREHAITLRRLLIDRKDNEAVEDEPRMRRSASAAT